jgi:OOP family OmpA-OmpF porin
MTMLRTKNYVFGGMGLAALFLLSACAGTELKVEPIPVSENPTEQLNRLDTEVTNGRKDQLNVLAPIIFAEAEASLNDARQALKRGDELTGIFEKIATGRAQIQRAQEVAQLARTALPEAIKARELARSAGATGLGEDYVEAEEQFLGLTRAIEKNNIKYAQGNKMGVAAAFDQLELRAIKEQTIGKARMLINQAEKEGAPKIAPTMFAVAQEKLREADAFISEHRYNKEKMLMVANQAHFQAQRLLEVLRQSRQFQTMEPEQIALRVEDILHKIAGKLAAPDMRNNTFDTQVENILGSIGALQEDDRFFAEKVKAQQEESEALKKQLATKETLAAERLVTEKQLAAERRFNQLYTEVQSFFEPDEAEVYKRGNQLILRVRGIQFPVGSAVIMPNNYELLSKVQRSIRNFQEPDVVIEGHTDSTGSDEVNDHLSQKRAEAVRDYLVANRTLPAEKILAVGYGSGRPLASNKTEEGRAINRRIDVVITPTPASMK